MRQNCGRVEVLVKKVKTGRRIKTSNCFNCNRNDSIAVMDNTFKTEEINQLLEKKENFLLKLVKERKERYLRILEER